MTHDEAWMNGRKAGYALRLAADGEAVYLDDLNWPYEIRETRKVGKSQYFARAIDAEEMARRLNKLVGTTWVPIPVSVHALIGGEILFKDGRIMTLALAELQGSDRLDEAIEKMADELDAEDLELVKRSTTPFRLPVSAPRFLCG